MNNKKSSIRHPVKMGGNDTAFGASSPANDVGLDKLESSIREGLIKDFNHLYVKEYATDWDVKRVIRETEIDIMRLENTVEAVVKFIKADYKAGYKAALDDYQKKLAEHKLQFDVYESGIQSGMQKVVEALLPYLKQELQIREAGGDISSMNIITYLIDKVKFIQCNNLEG